MSVRILKWIIQFWNTSNLKVRLMPIGPTMYSHIFPSKFYINMIFWILEGGYVSLRYLTIWRIYINFFFYKCLSKPLSEIVPSKYEIFNLIFITERQIWSKKCVKSTTKFIIYDSKWFSVYFALTSLHLLNVSLCKITWLTDIFKPEKVSRASLSWRMKLKNGILWSHL